MVHVDSTFVVQQAGYYVSKVINHKHESVWSNTLTIPLYVSILSFVFLVFQGIFASKFVKKVFVRLGWANEEGLDVLPEVKGFRARVAAHGGTAIYLSEVLRVIGCAALVGLSASIFLTLGGPQTTVLGFVSIAFVSSP